MMTILPKDMTSEDDGRGIVSPHHLPSGLLMGIVSRST